MSDQFYQLHQSLTDNTEIAPTIHQITYLRKKINKKLEQELFPTESCDNTNGSNPVTVDINSNSTPTQDKFSSTLLDMRKVINFIFTIHSARFGVNTLPADVEFKFTFDGRMNAKKEEVLIALVPCNTLFPPQSTYSTF